MKRVDESVYANFYPGVAGGDRLERLNGLKVGFGGWISYDKAWLAMDSELLALEHKLTVALREAFDTFEAEHLTRQE